MHHFVVINVDIDRPERVTPFLDIQCVVVDWHIPQFDDVHLLADLKLSCGSVSRKYLFAVSPRFFWHSGLSDVPEHVIMNT